MRQSTAPQLARRLCLNGKPVFKKILQIDRRKKKNTLRLKLIGS
jgi:hypothetical protein